MMQETNQSESKFKTISSAFWIVTAISIIVYIAYAILGFIEYKKLGRFPAFTEYIANLLKQKEPVTVIYKPYFYMLSPQLIASVLFGIRLILVGFRYQLEEGDSKPFLVYTAFAITDFIESLKDLYFLADRIPVLLRIASPFICLASFIASIVLSIKLLRSSSWKLLKINVYTEVFRLIVLPLCISALLIDIRDILLGILLFCVMIGLDGAVTSKINAPVTVDKNAKKREKLLGKIEIANNRINQKETALAKHNRKEFGYEFVENKPMQDSIDSWKKKKDNYQKELDKLD